MSRRIRVTVSYDGTEFHGWQVQPGLPTIQGVLEEIVGGIEGSPLHVAGSGRTDAGVHARAQVAAFTLTNPIPADNLRRAMNRLLPAAIRVVEACETHADFHPRFDAVAKTYTYAIYRGETCSPFEWRYVHHHPYPLDEAAMIAAALVFEGEHDFRAFAASDPRDETGKSKVRTIFNSRLVRSGDLLLYTVRGSGFLKHMVRNIVGTLIETGRGNLDAAAIATFFAAGFAGKAGSTAPAKGLTMQSVEYSPRANLSA
ncbi:MAG TPA: tRNA pseudouridine(38-40) synthase TruA [Bryobacteraceae bacterium]|jgi:tRNA pseudouridine38-40 synthase|nr:tRNA pseudouridine(38-40) synthase TruA [Bryobacteraceae bacterium]